MPVTFQAGRLAPVRTKLRLKLRPFLAVPAAPPASVDWFSKVTDWPMYLNSEIGDCTAAMVAHNLQNTSTYGDGATVTVTDDDVVAAYSRVSGYRPGHPETDRGAVLQDVYADWRKNGMAGHKALAFAEVEPSDAAEVKTAINVFGAVGVGMVVTETMMADFNTRARLGPYGRPVAGRTRGRRGRLRPGRSGHRHLGAGDPHVVERVAPHGGRGVDRGPARVD